MVCKSLSKTWKQLVCVTFGVIFNTIVNTVLKWLLHPNFKHDGKVPVLFRKTVTVSS